MMSKPYFEWRQNSPSELAQYVQLDLPESLRWPTYIARLDMLTHEGPQGVVAQLYKQLLQCKINYDLAPFDPRAGIIQQIRKPQTILEAAQGTCLDLAVLLAGMCLANDLLPIIIAVEGHAFLGVSLANTRATADQAAGAAAFNNGVLENLVVLQQWAEDGDRFVFVECTGAARSQGSLDPGFPEGQGRTLQGTMSFDQACQAGQDQILKATGPKNSALGANQREFLYALHIHDLQVKYGFPPVADDDELENRSASSVIQQHVEHGVSVKENSGTITTTEQSGGINFGSGNSIGSIGDVIHGDKVGGDKVSGDKIDARGSQGFLDRPSGTVNQNFGDSTKIDTSGGDYAEGSIDKRQGAFVSGGTVYGPITGTNSGQIKTDYRFDGEKPAQAGSSVTLADVRRTVRQASNVAYDRGDSSLANGLDEIEQNLRAAIQAEAAGNNVQRARKLRQVTDDLTDLAGSTPELQELVKLVQQIS